VRIKCDQPRAFATTFRITPATSLILSAAACGGLNIDSMIVHPGHFAKEIHHDP